MGRSVAISVTVSMRQPVLEPSEGPINWRPNREQTKNLRQRNAEVAAVLLDNLEFIALHFPLDSNEEIEMHAFRLEPGLQIFT